VNLLLKLTTFPLGFKVVRMVRIAGFGEYRRHGKRSVRGYKRNA